MDGVKPLSLGGLQPGRAGATTIVGGIAVLIAVPIVVIVARVGADSDGLWQHLASTVLPEYLRNTLLLGLGVAALTLLIGVGTAWMVTLCRFPGASVFRWALLLPFAIPTYLGAYAYTDLFQYSGPFQTWLRDIFGWQANDYWFPEVRSLSGAILVLSLALYPYVYLAARAAFVEQSVCALEVGRTLGLGPWGSFFRIALPLVRPSIVAGLALVLMETLAEFGAVEYCAVDTLATGIYRAFKLPEPHALTAAAQLSACLLVPIVLLLALEAWSRRTARFHHTSVRYRRIPSWPLRGIKAGLAFLACATPVFLGFVLPFSTFVVGTIRGGDRRAFETFATIGGNSVFLAALASVVAVVLAGLVAYACRRHPTTLHLALSRVAGIGYAIPGAVIAIGVLIPLIWLDQKINAVFGIGLLFTGSVAAVIYGYQTRFFAVSLNLISAGLTRIQPTIDDAARTLGASPARTLGRVHLPMLKGTLLGALLLVFVDVIKELPVTLILRPFNFETLAVRVYQLASDERLAEASTGALAIILIGLVPVVFMSRMLDRARPGEEDLG